MASVTKEIPTGTPTANSSVPQTLIETKPAPTNLRPDAVSLQVAVKVHGTRLASDGASPQTERFEEETNSMIVFPEGGVIRMTTPVSVGQMLVLTNLKSRQDAICRVAKVRKGYVEIEFTRPQAQYWGVYFTARNQRPAAATLPKMPAAPPAISSVVPEVPVAPILPSLPQESAAPEVVRDTPNFHETNPSALVVPPAPPVKPPAPVKPLAPVVARPAQKVQPYARPTGRLGVPDEVIPTIADSTEPPAYSSDLPSFTQPELHIAGSPAPAPKPPELDATQDASTAIASAEVEAEQALPSPAEKTQTAPVLGASLRPTTSRSAGSLALIFDTENDQPQLVTRAPERNWFVIGAGVALLLATIAGGAWYFQVRVGSNPPVAPANTNVSAQPAQPTQQPTGTQPQSPAPQSTAPEVQVASIPAEEPVKAAPKEESAPLAPKANKAANTSKPSTETSSRSAAAEPPTMESKPASKPAAARLITPAMKAHPLSAQRSIDLPGQAPALDTSVGAAPDSANLLGLDSSNAALPPPPPGVAAQAPVRVGGTVKAPQLISRAMPEYPFAAKEANVQGDVVIDTLISANGSVARMKVISGPAMLREAALNALRRWRYQPSELDGKPVAVQMLVTIRFRL